MPSVTVLLEWQGIIQILGVCFLLFRWISWLFHGVSWHPSGVSWSFYKVSWLSLYFKLSRVTLGVFSIVFNALCDFFVAFHPYLVLYMSKIHFLLNMKGYSKYTIPWCHILSTLGSYIPCVLPTFSKYPHLSLEERFNQTYYYNFYFPFLRKEAQQWMFPIKGLLKETNMVK